MNINEISYRWDIVLMEDSSKETHAGVRDLEKR